MDFGLSEEQKMLKRSAKEFLREESPLKLVKEMVKDEKGYSPQLWHNMAELGWLGLVFPVDYGGEGSSFIDIIILLEEMGYALLPSPFFASVILGGLSILEAGSEEQKKRYLPEVAKGDLLLTLAVAEPGTRYEGDPTDINIKATPHQDDFVINGTKLFIPYAHVADYLICVTRTGDGAKASEGITTFIVDAKRPGITCTPLDTIGEDNQCEVRFENVMVSRQDILGSLDKGWPNVENVLQKATIALCAYMNGSTQRVHEMTVDYAKGRVQWGRPIGSFQIIQHHCVDMKVALEASSVLTYEAASKLSQGVRCPEEVSAAKSWASESYRKATWYGMEIHGGVGCTLDYVLPYFYTRAKAAELTLGDADLHREKIASELLD
jgi:alkylation response protein AidB-like acyl-CoA dehydrogenase